MLNKIMNMLNEDKLDSLAKNYELKKSLADLWNKSYEKNEYLIKMSELT